MMASQRDLAEELIALASEDAVAAGAMLDVGVVTDRIVGFHAQQAVEKALKAVLAVHDVEFRSRTISVHSPSCRRMLALRYRRSCRRSISSRPSG